MDINYHIEFKLNQFYLLQKSEFSRIIPPHNLKTVCQYCPKWKQNILKLQVGCVHQSFFTTHQHHTSKKLQCWKEALLSASWRENCSVILTPEGLENRVSVGLYAQARFTRKNWFLWFLLASIAFQCCFHFTYLFCFCYKNH